MLLGLTPRHATDLFTQFLFIVVVSLFGVMNLGAVVGFVLDGSERRATLARLQAP